MWPKQTTAGKAEFKFVIRGSKPSFMDGTPQEGDTVETAIFGLGQARRTPAGPGPSVSATFQGISGGAGWPAAARARASRFQLFRSRWQRLTEIHRPGLPPSSLTNRRSPVQSLITFGRFGSHQMVSLGLMYM